MDSVVVPDTNVLLAIGFGHSLDSQAQGAGRALALATRRLVRVVAPPSVELELERKLSEIDAVYDALQSRIRTLQETDEDPIVIAEGVFRELRQTTGPKVRRFIDAIESAVSLAVEEFPSAPVLAVLSHVVGQALLLREGIKIRSHPSSVDFLDYPTPDPSPLEPPIPGLKGADLTHVKSCQELGRTLDSKMIFIGFDKEMFDHKTEIEARFDRVIITRPAFLKAYLP